MANFQWYLTDKRKQLLSEIETMPDFAKKSHSEIIEMALEEFFKIHGKGNPSFKLDFWTDNPEFIAIPALLAEKSQRNKWIELQAQKRNYTDLKTIKAAIEEWNHQLRKFL